MGANNLLWAVVIYGALTTPAPAAHKWSCQDVPYWVRNYSHARVESTMVSVGMAQWEINRLLRCLPKETPNG
jgi:hypothetical protein